MERYLKLALASGFLAGLLGISQSRAQGQAKSPTAVTPAAYLRLRTEFKKRGRWGPNDERGPTNLITAAKILSATKLVKTGLVVSLARPVPQMVDPEVPAGAVFHRVTNGITATNTTRDHQ